MCGGVKVMRKFFAKALVKLVSKDIRFRELFIYSLNLVSVVVSASLFGAAICLAQSDPLTKFDGTWIAVNPPGPQVTFYRGALGQREASLPMGQAALRLSDGDSGSNMRLSGAGFNCFYLVGFTTPGEMVWELKRGESVCGQSVAYRKIGSFDENPAPSSTVFGNGSSNQTQTKSEDICRNALDSSKTNWDPSPSFSYAVAEALRRGLSLSDCRLLLREPNQVTAISISPGRRIIVAQPSFDCSKASVAAEQLICSDGSLAAADIRLADSYARSLRRLGAQDQRSLRNTQRAWLRVRDASCNLPPYFIDLNSTPDSVVGCLLNQVEARIGELNRW